MDEAQKEKLQKKQELIGRIASAASQGLLSREETVAAYDAGMGVSSAVIGTISSSPSAVTPNAVSAVGLGRKIGIAEILSYVGAAIVFLGIAILIYQNWSTLSAFTKILATLGSGVAAYLVGIFLSREEKYGTVGTAFYLISALVLPIGLAVAFNNAGWDVGTASVQSIISAVLFLTFLASYFVSRKSLFVLFAILFGTWLFFAFTSLIMSGAYVDFGTFSEYRLLGVGLAYIFLGNAFSRASLAQENSSHGKLPALSSLTGFLYSFGILGFLGSALALGGWQPNQNAFWELIFIGLVFATLFLSVYLKSQSFLTFGTLFLMVYILKITGEYFAGNLGWSLSLVIAGLLLIAVGFASFSLKKKYFI